MRAFIGIKLKDCLQEIINIQNTIKKVSPQGNFTSKENIHVTLSFLGEIDENQVNIVKKLFNDIKVAPFALSISKVRKIRDMVVLEVDLNDSLINLQREIESKLIENNFKIEKRKFYPHITIIRNSEFDLEQKIVLKTVVKECFLFSSERINNVLIYTPILKKIF